MQAQEHAEWKQGSRKGEFQSHRWDKEQNSHAPKAHGAQMGQKSQCPRPRRSPTPRSILGGSKRIYPNPRPQRATSGPREHSRAAHRATRVTPQHTDPGHALRPTAPRFSSGPWASVASLARGGLSGPTPSQAHSEVPGRRAWQAELRAAPRQGWSFSWLSGHLARLINA